MREIKFRAWDNKNKVWLLGYEYPSLGGFSMFGEVMLMGEWSNVVDRFVLQQKDVVFEDLCLMQYTGLKDKNGKEIYEGDIVKYNDCVCEVYWDYAGFRIKPMPNSAITSHIELEVIGNIYENPELIK